MPDGVRWIRSYVLEEGDGAVGTVCIYQAASPEAIREHAQRADLPADEIIKVADTVFVAALFTPWAVPIGIAITFIFLVAWFWPTSPRKEGEAPA